MRSLEGTRAHESKLYYEFSHLYDKVFTRVFYPRIEEVVHSLDIPPNARVLEVGAGTGLAFPAYPTHARVTGIDLAAEMLEQAHDKIVRNGWRHIHVVEMDALNLTFEDNSFDYATAFHVVSVVPDARRLMQEVIRVTKPGATIVVINHFRSTKRLLAALDSLIEPATLRLGWHTLRLADVIEGMPLEVKSTYKRSKGSLFTIVVARNTKSGTA
jgi:phosphatidylethanolamine/phosphatidyl-N-methylethanolamine N-methyltransferase